VFVAAKSSSEGREDRQIARAARGKNDIVSVFPSPIRSPDKREVLNRGEHMNGLVRLLAVIR